MVVISGIDVSGRVWGEWWIVGSACVRVRAFDAAPSRLALGRWRADGQSRPKLQPRLSTAETIQRRSGRTAALPTLKLHGKCRTAVLSSSTTATDLTCVIRLHLPLRLGGTIASLQSRSLRFPCTSRFREARTLKSPRLHFHFPCCFSASSHGTMPL